MTMIVVSVLSITPLNSKTFSLLTGYALTALDRATETMSVTKQKVALTTVMISLNMPLKSVSIMPDYQKLVYSVIIIGRIIYISIDQ